jgi:hypothetical protein
MLCKLCLQDKPLIKAHIIPDFMYQELYDPEHKIFKISGDIGHIKKISTGEYDDTILCEECDNKIGKFETYASKVFYGGKFPIKEMPKFQKMINQHKIESMAISNLDYKKFKLFLLSILWRGSITKRETFNDVTLPENINERLRLMIINEDPGEPYDFPCIMITNINNKDMYNDLINYPRCNVDKSIFMYLIVGTIYIFHTAEKCTETNELKEAVLNKNNEMRIIYLPRTEAAKFLNLITNMNIYK